MSRKPFTEEEILLLRQNPYTYSVNPVSIEPYQRVQRDLLF